MRQFNISQPQKDKLIAWIRAQNPRWTNVTAAEAYKRYTEDIKNPLSRYLFTVVMTSQGVRRQTAKRAGRIISTYKKISVCTPCKHCNGTGYTSSLENKKTE